jgi:hypothetical protein
MSQFNNATDLPDWTVGDTLQGNTLVNTSSSQSGTSYGSPVLYCAGAPSMTIYAGAPSFSSGFVQVLVQWLPTATSVSTFNQGFQFSAAGSMAMAIPCLFPYCYISVANTSAANPWVLQAFLSGMPVAYPVSLRKGIAGAFSNMSVPPGNTTFYFPYIIPGQATFTYFLANGTGFFLVEEASTGDSLWSSGGYTGTQETNGNGSCTLTANQCSVIVVNSGGSSTTASFGIAVA